MRCLTLLAALALGALLARPLAAQECGTAEGVCRVGLGNYRLVLPESAGGGVPALLWLHGWGGSAAGVMKNGSMRRQLAARGYALIAPDGMPRAEHRNSDWDVRDEGRHPRDDVAFLTEVLADAASRGVDRQRVLVAGFSRGSSMVWDLACLAPEAARAYAAIAGAFWQPLPQGCAGPVDLYHVHGWTDRVVPLEGRAVAGGALTQGDVFASLAILRRTNGCDARQPDTAPMQGKEWRRRWTGCAGGSIELMLHPGGHGVPTGWLAGALDWFEGLDGAR